MPYASSVFEAIQVRAERQTARFDVVCAGEARWKLVGDRFQPAAGPVRLALALAAQGVRVGLATVLPDDTFGRSCFARIAAAGVDVGGVSLASPRSGFVRVDVTARGGRLLAGAEEEPPLEVPVGWSSRLLLLSGITPVVSHAAASCKAARAARRKGGFVLIDFNASLHLWAGRDPRTIQMVLHEVDAARCSVADLAALGTDVAAVRAALRPRATLMVADGTLDDRTKTIATALTRPGAPTETMDDDWLETLR